MLVGATLLGSCYWAWVVRAMTDVMGLGSGPSSSSAGHAGPVVVGYDGSPASREALRWAAAEAAARSVGVHVLHVQAPLPAEMVGYAVGTGYDLGEYELSGLALLEDARLFVESLGLGISVSVALEHEAVTPALLDASSSGASLLVIGSRGRGGFAGLLLGSTSTQVTSHSACPVIVVHDPAHRSYRGEATEFAGRVVIGLDGSELSRDAMQFAFEYAAHHGLGVTALHTWDIPVPDTVPPIVVSRQELEAVQDDELALTMSQLASWTAKYSDVSVIQKVIRGSAASVLVRASADAALVVVGSRGRGGFLGLLLGSVSQALLQHAICPVAVVRPTS